MRITGVSSGSYYLIVQGSTVTSALTFSSSSTTVANALYAAAAQITSGRECLSFGVTRTAGSDGNTVYLDVSFYVDNTLPLTLLDVFNGEVSGMTFVWGSKTLRITPGPCVNYFFLNLPCKGTNSSYSVVRTQIHSVIPTGSFELTYSDSTLAPTKIQMPFDANPDAFQSKLQALRSSILVCSN